MKKPEYDMKFDYDSHSYLCNGFPIPSVSALLETKYPFPEHLKNTVKISEAIEYGNAVHSVTEALDLEQEPPWSPYDLTHAIKSWTDFKERENASIYYHDGKPMVEVIMANIDLWYCGTIDRIMEIDGKLWIVDIKSGWLSTRGSVQVAGYAIMARLNGIDIDNAMLVSLREDEYTVKISKPHHYDWFLECLRLFYDNPVNQEVYQ